jgi:hypothetical protein
MTDQHPQLELIGLLQDSWIDLQSALKTDDKERAQKLYEQVGTFAITLCAAYGYAPQDIELLLDGVM